MINAENPVQVTDTGTWRWVSLPGGSGQAQFFPSESTSSSGSTATNSNPAIGNGSTSTASLGTAGSGTANNTINLNSTATSLGNKTKVTSPFIAGPAPTAPDYTTLNKLQTSVGRQEAIAEAMKAYDQLSASTKATGFQAAQNAGTTYANRLMQSGINPTASGVVTAQSKMGTYTNLANIEKEKQSTRLDAVNKSDTLAAQIATTVANLQLSYASTLADWNQKNAAYELDLNKFNATQSLEGAKLTSNEEIEAAKLNQAYAAMSTSGSGSSSRGGSTALPVDNSWRNVFAGTMAGSDFSASQQYNRNNLATYLTQNDMWNNQVPSYTVI